MLLGASARNPSANAPAGARFHNRGPLAGTAGRSRMKSHSRPEAGLESPTGFRSRGPSAERQVRKAERLKQTMLHAMEIYNRHAKNYR